MGCHGMQLQAKLLPSPPPPSLHLFLFRSEYNSRANHHHLRLSQGSRTSVPRFGGGGGGGTSTVQSYESSAPRSMMIVHSNSMMVSAVSALAPSGQLTRRTHKQEGEGSLHRSTIRGREKGFVCLFLALSKGWGGEERLREGLKGGVRFWYTPCFHQ